MNLADQYAQLRNDGYDERGAGIQMALSLDVQRALERSYHGRKASLEKVDHIAALRPSYGAESSVSHEMDFNETLDQKHVALIMAKGGYPRATIRKGKGFWVGPDDRRWRPAA